jgi:hypothetical protein
MTKQTTEEKIIKSFRKQYPDYSEKDCIIFIEFLKRYPAVILFEFFNFLKKHEQPLSR